MEANPRNLDELFNSQLRYAVPMFQRLYGWKESPQWANLWDDISESPSRRSSAPIPPVPRSAAASSTTAS